MIEYLSLWGLALLLMAAGLVVPAIILAVVSAAIVFRAEWLA